MRQPVESVWRSAALAAFVAVLVVGIYDRWIRRRRPGHRGVVLNAGAVALDGGTVTVLGGAAGKHGGQ
ncbi:MAG TPA: hypothetical protein VH573_11825 [Mycobacteriales bacterium]|jgi:hypothetical protein